MVDSDILTSTVVVTAFQSVGTLTVRREPWKPVAMPFLSSVVRCLFAQFLMAGGSVRALTFLAL